MRLPQEKKLIYLSDHMLYLKVTDLKKSYTAKVLIDGVDCTISK